MSESSDISPRPPAGSLSVQLCEALGEGNPRVVRALIEAGADVHYQREAGYDALLDAVHGRDVAQDPRLIELLTLLIAHGINLSSVTSYGESGLRVLSRLGRFDAVRVLLAAGADRSQLEWTPLMEAVALGSFSDVQTVLAQGALLEKRDWWSRTAWLIALLSGDIEKAKLLREHGADTQARGRCGSPPLFYAIHGHHANVLQWLLQEGADFRQSDDFGTTPLMAAVENDDLACVEILLDAGAEVEVNANGTALSSASSREVIMRLLDAGADPADADQRVVLGLQCDSALTLAAVSRDDFRRAPTRIFGQNNPERMNQPFWEAMIRCGASAYEARITFEDSGGNAARPIWCAQRFGQTLTLLSDGRAIQIGGEHEDFYDPDFCIYNDVFVHEHDGSIAIYGYPDSVFEPTDFHTATLVGNSIYLIGCLGYQEARRYGETPVYKLNVDSLRIDRLSPRGEQPGWIYKHRALVVSSHEIRIWGGLIATESSTESEEPNVSCFVLDVDRLVWRSDK
jgi:ankyrin repeat protein